MGSKFIRQCQHDDSYLGTESDVGSLLSIEAGCSIYGIFLARVVESRPTRKKEARSNTLHDAAKDVPRPGEVRVGTHNTLLHEQLQDLNHQTHTSASR